MKIQHFFTLLTTFIFILLCNGQLHAQVQATNFTAENFNILILSYEPPHRKGVPEKDFQRGSFYLEQTLSATKGKAENLNAADYWNITMAFIKLQEPKDHIALAFQMANENDPEAICELLVSFGKKTEDLLTQYIPETLEQVTTACSGLLVEKRVFDPAKYASEHGLNLDLVALMDDIRTTDQLYRGQPNVDWSKQNPIDQRNMQRIDSLYQVHQTYIGKTLVGEELAATMWAVVQHSTIEKMEEYLPVIHQGVQVGNLHPTPLKMLLDRIHAIKYGYQFFGSQGGVDIATKEKRAKIIREYGLE